MTVAGRGFEVDLDDGSTVATRRLLVATGLRDEVPDVDGLSEHWGEGVFHCPCCAGCEVGERTVAVLGCGPESMNEAHLLSRTPRTSSS